MIRPFTRYVTVPDPSEEWWKKPSAEMQNGVADNAATATNGPAAAATASAAATTNGETAAENDVKTAEDTSDDTTPSSDGLVGNSIYRKKIGQKTFPRLRDSPLGIGGESRNQGKVF